VKIVDNVIAKEERNDNYFFMTKKLVKLFPARKKF